MDLKTGKIFENRTDLLFETVHKPDTVLKCGTPSALRMRT